MKGDEYMSVAEQQDWQMICAREDLVPGSGVCALVEGEQVALFYLPGEEQEVYALSNRDPIGDANVLSRGVIGDISGRLVVASPLYKQHFDLVTGQCLALHPAALTWMMEQAVGIGFGKRGVMVCLIS